MTASPALPVVSKSSAPNPGAKIDYELFLDCVHCGLCTASCPTYVELGDENDSPRGRIYLMRAVTDGRLELNSQVRNHLELCLDCRSCETACPSGVQYGKLIEPFRIEMERQSPPEEQKTNNWFHRWILFGMFPYPDRLRWALWPARIAQFLWLDRLFMTLDQWGWFWWLPAPLRRLPTMLPPAPAEDGELPEELPAKGKKRARVALFLGCVGDTMFRNVHWATARVLQENGCDVVVPREQNCCGAIHFHAASEKPAKDFAENNIRAFDAAGVDAVITNVAGCGAMLKDYPHHWHDDPKFASFAGKVKDVHEFLDQLGLVAPRGEIPYTATYHDACHLGHAQKVKEQPRRILAQVPGLKMIDLPETEICCGAAGSYNLTQTEMADRLGERKIKNILGTRAQLAITANAGCHIQILREAKLRGAKLPVLHPMEILDASYRGVGLEV